MAFIWRFSRVRLGRGKYYMLGLFVVNAEWRYLAKSFNLEISGLADRFLMEIEKNVNLRRKRGSFQRYLLRTEKICALG